MHSPILAAAALLLPLTFGLPTPTPEDANIRIHGTRSNDPFFVLQTNDDGWMDCNLVQFYHNLTGAGIKSVISATARDMTGIVDEGDVMPLGPEGCIYGSCPANSPGHGGSPSNHAFNYVNAAAPLALKYGLHNLNPNYNGGKPDMVLVGPNQGHNVGLPPKSGTIAAARAAAEMGIPAIAFSGATNVTGPYNDSVPLSSRVYAELALNLTQKILNSGQALLPEGTFLSVNFSPVSETHCPEPSQFAWIMTRPKKPQWLVSKDMSRCSRDHLPQEKWAIKNSKACWATVSLIRSDNMQNARPESQEILARKLGSMLSCGFDSWFEGDFASQIEASLQLTEKPPGPVAGSG